MDREELGYPIKRSRRKQEGSGNFGARPGTEVGQTDDPFLDELARIARDERIKINRTLHDIAEVIGMRDGALTNILRRFPKHGTISTLLEVLNAVGLDVDLVITRDANRSRGVGRTRILDRRDK